MPVDFFAFLTARAAVSLVTAMLTIAIGWHLYQNSGDPFDLALVGLMQVVPIFLFFSVTGWTTDSLPRKAPLIICTITDAVILIGITMAILADDLNLTVIFALLFAYGGVVVGLGLAALPPMQRSGLCLFAALLVFAASILVFAVSTIFWVSLVTLFVYGAADMVSVNTRMTLIQLATPNYLHGRVSAVNAIFISSSNEMGDARAASAAALLGPVTTVFIAGLAALGLVIGGWYVFPKLRHLDRLADLCPTGKPSLKGNKNER